MGRHSTGAITTDQALRIELSYLLKHGLIKKNTFISSSLTWKSCSNIGFKSFYDNEQAYKELKYTNTNKITNKVTNHVYRIQLTSIPSNLGKGEVLYFVFPVVSKNCRILYHCYSSTIWKSREAYQNRIYYEDQLTSKRFRPYKYFFCEKELWELYNQKTKAHYSGKPTRIINRIRNLEKNG